MTEAVAIRTALVEFREAFESGIVNIVKAAEIYVRAIDDNPRNADVFKEEFADSIPTSAWSGFEAVGRKWMHPRLIMGGMVNRKKTTLVKRLPYSMQERVFERERFDLLTASGEILKVDLLEATEEQAEQLCNGSEIRNIAAQKAYIEAQKAAATVEPDAPELMPYTVADGKVSFRRGVTLTRAELKRLLQEM